MSWTYCPHCKGRWENAKGDTPCACPNTFDDDDWPIGIRMVLADPMDSPKDRWFGVGLFGIPNGPPRIALTGDEGINFDALAALPKIQFQENQ